jgi:exodeoxyribonuclease VII large subunit
MSGTVELDPDGSNLLIRFAYREDLVALVKSLPERRWDPKGKVWRVPVALVERVYTTFSRHLFEFAPEVSSALAGTLGRPAADPAGGRAAAPAAATTTAPATAAAGDDPPPALSVSVLNTKIRDGLRQQFPTAFWVVGEVIDFDKSAGREHRFFQLAEKARGQPRAVAVVEVALFAATAARLLPRLAAGDDPFTLRDGIEIRVLVKVDLYVASGRYQVVVQDIDPSFTLGKLALSREQILRQLRDQGLHDRNRSLGFPVPALRIGVLASPDSDGWNDFVRHLQESGGGFDVTLVPTKVQGIELKPMLLRGLAWFRDHAAEFDVLCIVRGGGSRTDLAWFDDRDLAWAVATHPLKVVVGIGHQRDQSVLDAIAHSEKTPTAVAELLVRAAQSARDDLAERTARLQQAVRAWLADQRDRLATLARTVSTAVARDLHGRRQQLAGAARGLAAATALRLQHERAALRAAGVRARHGAERRLERATARLDQQTTRQRLLDPARVLGRGYALLRDASGRVRPSARGLARDEVLHVHLRDGRATTRVLDVTTDTP